MKYRPLFMLFCLWGIFAGPSAGHAAQEGRTAAGPISDDTPLIFMILPVEHVNVMYEKFLPLKDYLERTTERKIILKVARDYRQAIESIGTGKAHLAYLDPSAYCEARHRYGIIPLARAVRSGSATYRSVIVTREDSGLEKIVEGRGKKLALGNLRSSSSSLIPAVMYKEVGIGLDDFRRVDYLEHEDRIALSVLTRRHDLGGLSEQVAARYLPHGLRTIKTSEAIPQYTICASPNLPGPVRERIRHSLLKIDRNRDEELVSALKDIDGFARAEDRDFDVVRIMIKNLTGENYLKYGPKTVKVAILPLYSAITLYDRFDPLMRYLTHKTGYEFKLVIPRDFEDFFATVKRGEVEFSYSNPYIYIQLADEGHLRAFGTTILESTGDIFRGIIITRSDSPIRTLDDLRGRNVMVVSYRSAAGFLAQKLFLREKNIDVFSDMNLSEGRRQEEVILNVYRRSVDAGFVRESALDVLSEEIDLEQIRVLARTPYIANWPFAATRSADEALIGLVQKSLMDIANPAVLSAAQIQGFKPAKDGDFDELRGWIQKHAVE